MTKFIIGYDLPYTHRVTVGIEARDSTEALNKAEELFNKAELSQNTKEVPLLEDDFYASSLRAVQFRMIKKLHGTETWPTPSLGVRQQHKHKAAVEAARLLVEAYRLGEENGGSIDWEDIDRAYTKALDI